MKTSFPVTHIGPVSGKRHQCFIPSLVDVPLGQGSDTTVIDPKRLRREMGWETHYRVGSVYVGPTPVGPPPELVPQCMQELVWYMSLKGCKQIKGWYSMLYLISVHPWRDGNGRTGRYLYRLYTGSSESTQVLRARYRDPLQHFQGRLVDISTGEVTYL